jgi:hypothetical protein
VVPIKFSLALYWVDCELDGSDDYDGLDVFVYNAPVDLIRSSVMYAFKFNI